MFAIVWYTNSLLYFYIIIHAYLWWAVTEKAALPVFWYGNVATVHNSTYCVIIYIVNCWIYLTRIILQHIVTVYRCLTFCQPRSWIVAVLAVRNEKCFVVSRGCYSRIQMAHSSATEPGKFRGFRNRLGLERSPYLLQHANNPVDWYVMWVTELLNKLLLQNYV